MALKLPRSFEIPVLDAAKAVACPPIARITVAVRSDTHTDALDPYSATAILRPNTASGDGCVAGLFQGLDLPPATFTQKLLAGTADDRIRAQMERILQSLEADTTGRVPGAGQQHLTAYRLGPDDSKLVAINQGRMPIFYRQLRGPSHCHMLYANEAIVIEPEETVLYLYMTDKYRPNTELSPYNLAAIRFAVPGTRGEKHLQLLSDEAFIQESFPHKTDNRATPEACVRWHSIRPSRTLLGCLLPKDPPTTLHLALSHIKSLSEFLCRHRTSGEATFPPLKNAFDALGSKDLSDRYKARFDALHERITARVETAVCELVDRLKDSPGVSTRESVVLPPFIDVWFVAEKVASFVETAIAPNQSRSSARIKTDNLPNDQGVTVLVEAQGQVFAFTVKPFPVAKGVIFCDGGDDDMDELFPRHEMLYRGAIIDAVVRNTDPDSTARRGQWVAGRPVSTISVIIEDPCKPFVAAGGGGKDSWDSQCDEEGGDTEMTDTQITHVDGIAVDTLPQMPVYRDLAQNRHIF